MAGLVALAAAYVLSQFYRSFLAVLTPALSAEIGTTNADLSIASGVWFVTFALAQFAIGVSLDRYGPRRTASLLLALGGGGGAMLFASATQPWMVIAAMALIGIGCAPVLMASVFIFARTFTPARLAVLTSSLIGIGSAGNVIGAAPLAAAAEAFGWREVMLGLGAFTILIAVATWFLVRDPERIEHTGSGGGFAGYLDLFKIRALWLLLPLVAINYAPAAGIRGLWSGPYLSDVFSADAMVIGQVTLFMAFAMVVGNFVYGPLDTLFGTRKWVAVVGNVLGLVALTALALMPTASLTMVIAMFVAIGITGASYGLLVAHGRSFMPQHLTGRGMTLLNFFSIGGVGIMQFATGGIVTAFEDPADPTVAYQALFAFYAIMMAAALAFYLFGRDAKPDQTTA
jgi:MFS family permease